LQLTKLSMATTTSSPMFGLWQQPDVVPLSDSNLMSAPPLLPRGCDRGGPDPPSCDGSHAIPARIAPPTDASPSLTRCVCSLLLLWVRLCTFLVLFSVFKLCSSSWKIGDVT
jgi:hypothetical protein